MITSKHNSSKFFTGRFGPLFLAVSILCAISLLTRMVLFVASFPSLDLTVGNLFRIFIIGFLYDLAVSSYAFIPLVIYLWLFPQKWYQGKFNHVFLYIIFFLIIFMLSFNSVSEWFFWEEFSVRYNFIAVDYLIYTTEVIGNIRQSYPINFILGVLLAIAGYLTFLFRGTIQQSVSSTMRFKRRTQFALGFLCIPLLAFFGVNHEWKYQSNNSYVNELSGNGMYDFGFAFWHNELDYDTFYKTLPTEKIVEIFRTQADSTQQPDLKAFTTRNIVASGTETKLNVVMISVESLSANFLGSFGNTQNITPNLDSLAQQGILFTNLYASGTRTVRGLEALALSIPPTPGQSIVKRPNNQNLFTLGNVFRSKGYSSRFIYGGYGYFDNMTEFFSNNGYEVTDRSALEEKDIHYSNIWGVADEDLFTLSMRELDKDYKMNKPFFAQIMTVSNHRPYTYPEGRIDIPSHSSREGAVKYTDYAIGKFIREARHKPWFNNTIFVIVSDHCASSAGKVELPVDKYHIPMIIFSPGRIAPGRFEKLTAQIDVAPTLLGLLNFNYESKFFGQDVFKMNDSQQRAFISTYQSLGYIRDNKLVILEPNKKSQTFEPNFSSGNSVLIKDDEKLTNEAIANYQLASFLYQTGKYQFDKR